MEYVVKTNRKEIVDIVSEEYFDLLKRFCIHCESALEKYIFMEYILHELGLWDKYYFREFPKSWCVTNYKDTKILYIEF